MSSNVGAGAALPKLSWMMGPMGTVDSAGGRPRFTGTVLHRSVFFSGVHVHGSPIVEFTAIPGRRRIVPAAASPIQSSTLLSAVTVRKKCLPSGAHSGQIGRAHV